MTLVNPKPLGYAFGELLPSGHVNSVWAQLPLAIDGRGGSYTLSNPLTIAGAPLFTLAAPAAFLDIATFKDLVQYDSSSQVFFSGSTGFFGPINFEPGSVPIFSTATEFQDDVTFKDTVSFTTSSDVFFNGSNGFYGQMFFEPGCDPIFNAPATLNKPLAFGSGGYLRQRVLKYNGSSAGLPAVSPRDYDEVYIGSAYSGSTVTWTVDVTGVGDDACIAFVAHNSTVPIIISVGGVIGILCGVGGSNSGHDFMRRLEFRRVAGSWYIHDYSPTIYPLPTP